MRRARRRTAPHRPGPERWPSDCRGRWRVPAGPVRQLALPDLRGRRRAGPGPPVLPHRHRRTLWWQEGRPEEGGRITVVHRGADGKQRALLPAPWNARTRVHEYGGLSYLPVPRAGPGGRGGARARSSSRTTPTSGCTWPAGGGRADGAITAATADARPRRAACRRALRPALRRLRALPGPHRGLVRPGAARRRQGHPRRSSPCRWTAPRPTTPPRSASWPRASDFFAFPTPSPDGSRLAWICWNHPHMPWDGTELRVAAVDERGRRARAGWSRAACGNPCSRRCGGTTRACTWPPTGPAGGTSTRSG